MRCPSRSVCCWELRPSLEMTQTSASITESSRRSSRDLLASSSAVWGDAEHRSVDTEERLGSCDRGRLRESQQESRCRPSRWKTSK